MCYFFKKKVRSYRRFFAKKLRKKRRCKTIVLREKIYAFWKRKAKTLVQCYRIARGKLKSSNCRGDSRIARFFVTLIYNLIAAFYFLWISGAFLADNSWIVPTLIKYETTKQPREIKNNFSRLLFCLVVVTCKSAG